MTRPRIGITTPGREAADGKLRLTVDYIDAVRRAGGFALLLPPGDLDVQAALEACDGFVLTGGGDVDPALYGGRAHPEVYGVDRARDESEIALVRALVARRTPALCICRGLQILAVAHGGRLVEHVPDEYGEAVPHRRDGRYQAHAVRIDPASRLARALGTRECTPASWHHQSVREPGSGLRAVAWAPDGAIEALEHATHDRLWAVQWHPEHTALREREQQALFEAVVSAARGSRPPGGRERRTADFPPA
ncbi:MAG: gamma-glutamyl-gamma-aminobutyrate hydrolase family protein [Planctomycetes bacterium]|nr:gamma-glutamyl-gamma-aminobutyrate hydrolase family protein [Planctomycetota bacterium]